MLKRLLIIAALILPIKSLAIQPLSKINFHDITTDTVRINELLVEAEKIDDPSERIIMLAKKFEGTPYVARTLENPAGEEMLTINLDELDCSTFVETVAALAITAGQKRTTWRDYVATLENLRYRGGEMNGYPSRLHYFSDWVVDNTHRGNVKEITGDLPDIRTQTKTLDFMSRNADKYPALADSANLEGVKNFEMGYRNHRFNYIPWDKTNGKVLKQKLKDGDIIALYTKTPGLDVTHQGLIVKDDKGNPHMLHASMAQGKVVLQTEPLMEQLRRGRIPGVRFLRITE